MHDVIVVGAGVIGLSVGWTLLESGLDVVVIDKGRAGGEASSTASGMLCPVPIVEPGMTDLTRLALESMRLFPEFVARLEGRAGFSVGYDTTGTLLVALEAEEAQNLKRLTALQQELGLESAWLRRDGCHDLEPMLSHRTIGAVHTPHDRRVDTRLFLSAMNTAVRACGGEILEHTAVRAVVVEAGRVTGVQLDTEILNAKLVIVAAGAWSNQILSIPQGPPPIRPVKGQMVAVQMDSERPLVSHTIRGSRVYCVPRSDGRLLIGATKEEIGFEREITAGGLHELLSGAYELIPGIYELPVMETCCGFRPTSPDDLPLIGDSETPGLIYATGHGESGLLLSPVTSWAIGTLVQEGCLPGPVVPFSPARPALSSPTVST